MKIATTTTYITTTTYKSKNINIKKLYKILCQLKLLRDENMKNIQAVRKNGGSVTISVTGLAKIDEIYKLEKIDDQTIKMTRLE